MALAFLILACFLLYVTSKYFPIQGIPLVKGHKSKVNLSAGAISFFSLYLFAQAFDFATALMIWMIAFMTLLSAIILSVKMNPKWIWAWGALSFIFILLDFY